MGVDFSRIAERYDETRGGVQRGVNLAAELAPLLPDGPVLDVGVGTGVVAVALDRPVIGVDIAEGMLKLAATRMPGCVVRYDGVRLPFGDASLAAGYAVWVLHLVEDQRGLFREVRRVLRPSGRFVVLNLNLPPPDEIDRILRPMYDALLRDRVGLDRPARLVPVAESAGLTVVEIRPGPTFRTRVSPVEEAAKIERREGAAFWDLDESQWRQFVEPALKALRALGDREIERESTHDLLVLEREPG